METQFFLRYRDEESKLDWQVTATQSTLIQAPADAIELDSALEYTKDGHTFKSAPKIIVAPGQEASIQVGTNEGNTLEIKVIAERK